MSQLGAERCNLSPTIVAAKFRACWATQISPTEFEDVETGDPKHDKTRGVRFSPHRQFQSAWQLKNQFGFPFSQALCNALVTSQCAILFWGQASAM